MCYDMKWESIFSFFVEIPKCTNINLCLKLGKVSTETFDVIQTFPSGLQKFHNDRESIKNDSLSTERIKDNRKRRKRAESKFISDRCVCETRWGTHWHTGISKTGLRKRKICTHIMPKLYAII